MRVAAVWLPRPTLAPPYLGAGGCGRRALGKPAPRVGSYYTYGIVEWLGWVYQNGNLGWSIYAPFFFSVLCSR